MFMYEEKFNNYYVIYMYINLKCIGYLFICYNNCYSLF